MAVEITNRFAPLPALVAVRTLARPEGMLALGVATGLLEPAGWALAGTINAFSYLAWAVWLMVVGMVVLVRRSGLAPSIRPSAAIG